MKPLITDLPYPPMGMEYCYMRRILYVCTGRSPIQNDSNDGGFILALKLDPFGLVPSNETLGLTPGNPRYTVLRTIMTLPDDITKKPMRCNAEAGGSSIKLDMHGNLFFVEEMGKQIMKIPANSLEKVLDLPVRDKLEIQRVEVACEEVYSNETTKYITDIGGITIEREYLYWTNKHVPTDYPAISKAFTEPFIKQVPL
jgi:hypothetical protein